MKDEMSSKCNVIPFSLEHISFLCIQKRKKKSSEMSYLSFYLFFHVYFFLYFVRHYIKYFDAVGWQSKLLLSSSLLLLLNGRFSILLCTISCLFEEVREKKKQQGTNALLYKRQLSNAMSCCLLRITYKNH